MISGKILKLISVALLALSVGALVSKDTAEPSIRETVGSVEMFINTPGAENKSNAYYSDLMRLIEYVGERNVYFPLYNSVLLDVMTPRDVGSAISLLSGITFDGGNVAKVEKSIWVNTPLDKTLSTSQFTTEQKRKVAEKLFYMSQALLGQDFHRNLTAHIQVHKGTMDERESAFIREVLKILENIAVAYPEILEQDYRWADSLEQFALSDSFIYEQGWRADEVKERLMKLLIKYKRHGSLQKIAEKYFHSRFDINWQGYELYGRMQVRHAILGMKESPAGYDYYSRAKSFMSPTEIERMINKSRFVFSDTYFTGIVVLLFEENRDWFLDQYLDISKVRIMDDKQFTRSLQFISILAYMPEQILGQVKEQVVGFFNERLKTKTIKDVDEILRTYSVVSSVNIEWASAILPEIQRILIDELRLFDEQITSRNFMAVARFFAIYSQFKDSRVSRVDFNIPEVDAYIQRLVLSGAITRELLGDVPLESIQTLGLAINFVRQLPDSGDLIKMLLQDSGRKFLDTFDIQSVETFRKSLNVVSMELGDKMLVSVVGDRIDTIYGPGQINAGNLAIKFRDARSFYNPGGIERDVVGLYRLMANFMLTRIAEYVKQNPGDFVGSSSEESAAKIIEWLVEKGFIANNDSDWLKGFQALGGNWKYLAFKIQTKFNSVVTSTSESFGWGEVLVEPNSDYKLELGARVLDVFSNNRQLLAHVLKIDPNEGGRVKMMADVGRRKGGITGELLEISLRDKGRLIFDAPVSFTTGNAKPTEILIQDGIVKNYLISTEGKDGFIITDADGKVHVADKRDLWLHDLDAGVSPEQDRRLDITRKIDDYRQFLDVASRKRISLVSNMLLFDGNNRSIIDDGTNQRRLFLTFSDGSFGVLNGAIPLSTGDAVLLAIRAGAVKVVYMDTGQFDYTTIRPLGRAPVIWGHSDQRESSNRIGIYLEPDQSMAVADRAQDVGGIDLNPSKLDLQTQNAGSGLDFHIDPAQLQQIQNATGFLPVIIGIQPINSLGSFLGLKSAAGIQSG